MKILLVEDSDEIRERLRSLIDESGESADVSEVKGETEAVQRIHGERPDLMILDLSLAEGSGLGVLRSLKNCGNPPAVAVLTSYVDGPYRKKCLELGAKWFFDKAQGVEAVRRVIEQVGHYPKKHD